MNGATTLSITTLSIMTVSIMTFGITILSITTLSIMTLSITTLSITALSLMIFSIDGLFVTLDINDTRHQNTLYQVPLCYVVVQRFAFHLLLS
jgi:hypothetical protein